MDWNNGGPLVSEAEVDVFAPEHGIRLSDEHRRFLSTVSNGGYPSEEIAIPTVNCPAGAGRLAGLLGVNHPNDDLNYVETLGLFGYLAPDLVPFGHDQGSAQVFVDMAERPGRLVYVPLEELDDDPFHPCHVADSIAELLVVGVELNARWELEDAGASEQT